MWRIRAKDGLAIAIAVAIPIVLTWINWEFSDAPGQRPSRVAASIVNFTTPPARTALIRGDAQLVVTVRFANGQELAVSAPSAQLGRCRVDDTVVLIETVNRAGSNNWAMPPYPCN